MARTTSRSRSRSTRSTTSRRSARARTAAAQPQRIRSPAPSSSLLTKGQFYLNRHDEEKVLLFTTGIVFGVGLATTLLGKFVFGGLAALVIAMVLILIENNQKYHQQ